MEEVEEDEVEAVEAATADCEDEAKEEESKEEGSKDDNANEENEGNAADTTGKLEGYHCTVSCGVMVNSRKRFGWRTNYKLKFKNLVSRI